MNAFITYRQALETPDTVRGTPEDLAPDDFARFLDFLSVEKLGMCFLRGNEPMLHPELRQLLTLARDRRITPVVETCGLMPENGEALLREAGPPIIWKLYEPQVYTKPQWRELKARCAGLARVLRDRISVLAIFHSFDPAQAFALDFVRQHGLRAVTFRAHACTDIEHARAFCREWVPQALRLVDEGVGVSLDCGLPPCAFSDPDFGAMAKAGIIPGRCAPVPGILPDLSIYHCHALAHDGGDPLSGFERPSQLVDYCFDRYGDLQRDLGRYPLCANCRSCRTRQCIGTCLAVKQSEARLEAKGLEQAVATEGDAASLARLGTLYTELGQQGAAERVLTEARRIAPEDGDIHLRLARVLRQAGKIPLADAEYRKAMRLLPENALVQQEFQSMTRQAHQPGWAYRLLEKAERMRREEDSPPSS